MTARDIRRALRRFWPLTVAIIVGLLVIGAILSFVPRSKYQSDALLFAQPTNAQALDTGSTEIVSLILPAIVQQVGTDKFLTQVALRDPAVRRATLSASSTAGTVVMTVTAQSTDPQAAARAANAAAAQIVEDPITRSVRITVINPAFVAHSPSSPKKAEILLGCLVLGLILGGLAAVVADASRKRLAGADMIRDGYGLTVLGEIAKTRSTRLRPGDLFLTGSGSVELREDYERLRTTFGLLARDCHTVAVTSWAQGEGKTTVASNLAWSLASFGRSVTLVDFDLRRPSVHDRLDLDAEGGVAELLGPPGARRQARRGTGSTPPQEAGRSDAAATAVRRRLKTTTVPELTVLTAGHPVPQPARLIEQVFPQIERALEDRLVIFDTPPLLASETAMIASLVDAIVLVIDMQRRQPADLQAMIHVLGLAQTRILGVVLNRVDGIDREQQPPGYYAQQPPSSPAGGVITSAATDWGPGLVRAPQRRAKKFQ